MGLPIIYFDPTRGLFLLFRERPTTGNPNRGLRTYAILSMNPSSWVTAMVAPVDCQNVSPESDGMPNFRIQHSEVLFLSEAVDKFHDDQPFAFLKELISNPSAVADLAAGLRGEATEAEILLEN